MNWLTNTNAIVGIFAGLFAIGTPLFFGHGLTIHQCSTNEEILKHFNNDILQDAADLFAVNLEWLQGASEQVYTIHNLYKDLEKCRSLIETLTQSGNDLGGYVLNCDKSMTSSTYDVAIVFTEEIGRLNDRAIERIHI